MIPKELRDRLGLVGGRSVDICERDGHLEIEPAPTAMTLVRGRHGPVAVPDGELPPLDDDVVREVLERSRR